MDQAEPQLRSFCVIIPMYNEQDGAERCVTEICSALRDIPYKNQLVVVNDGSKDGTGPILDSLTAAFPGLHVIRHDRNAGYGAALQTGVRYANCEGFDYALFMDSDLTNNPSDIVRFVRAMETGADVIKASRFIASGGMKDVPRRRTVVSRLGNLIASTLFRVGVRDCTNGFRATKVSILARMNLKERGFPIIVEELYQAKWLASTFVEIPVLLTNRSNDQRPTSFSYRPKTFARYLSFALKAFLGIKPNLR